MFSHLFYSCTSVMLKTLALCTSMCGFLLLPECSATLNDMIRCKAIPFSLIFCGYISSNIMGDEGAGAHLCGHETFKKGINSMVESLYHLKQLLGRVTTSKEGLGSIHHPYPTFLRFLSVLLRAAVTYYWHQCLNKHNGSCVFLAN